MKAFWTLQERCPYLRLRRIGAFQGRELPKDVLSRQKIFRLDRKIFKKCGSIKNTCSLDKRRMIHIVSMLSCAKIEINSFRTPEVCPPPALDRCLDTFWGEKETETWTCVSVRE